MKSYTDLEQSKKLAEILSFESADQVWERIAIAGANLNVPEELQYRHNGDMPFQYYSGIGIPCWSLTALIKILPKGFLLMDAQHEADLYSVWVPGFTEPHIWKDNPLDAVFEMIIKLHELKML